MEERWLRLTVPWFGVCVWVDCFAFPCLLLLFGALGLLRSIPLRPVLAGVVDSAEPRPLGADDRRELKENEPEDQDNAMIQHRMRNTNEQHSMQC